MTHVSLFSGIGGLDLAAEWAGFETILQVEKDPYCRAVLKKHWPEVERAGDIRGLSLSGLVGCRQAQRIDGSEERSLESDVWIIAENVGHTWRRWVPAVRRDLWSIGYASVSVRVRASEIGASHDRHRAFVVANADSELVREFSRRWQRSGWEMAQELAGTRDWSPKRLGDYNGVPHRLDRLRALGNAVVPQQAYPIFKAIAEVEEK